MAGDQDLATTSSERRRHAPTGASGFDADALSEWLRWYTRWRLFVPVFVVPGAFVVHDLLGTPFDVPKILVISLATLPMTAASVLLQRRDADGNIGVRRLEWLMMAQTIWDTIFTALGVRYAGGAFGPFWPFVFVPAMIAAGLFPQRRALLLHLGVAIAAMALVAWGGPPPRVVAAMAMGATFAGFAIAMTSASARRTWILRSHRRELERLTAEKELAQAVARRREDILSVVSHELASPLTALRGYVRLLDETRGRERAGNSHLLERVQRQVDRISSLADDLLQMASTQTGAMQLVRAPLDLVETLREATEAARVEFPEAEIRLSGEPTLPGVWDRDRLDQLFGNLISNAMKFAGARSKVEIHVRREGARAAHVTVTDDGPGISPDALARIFEPFQRYSAERGGLGLGLAIAQTIVELHDGKIWAESPGRGATFHVVLPTDAQPSGKHHVVDSAPETPAAEPAR